MNGRMLTAGALVAAAGAVTVLSWATSPHRQDAATAEGTATGRPTAAVAVERVRVTSVVDGDTLRVAAPAGTEVGRVRLLGINAPEVDHSHGGAQCYGETATSVLRNLTPVGSTVTRQADPSQADRDVYGRLLRYVETTRGDVDEQLLRRGAARLCDSHPAVRRAQRYQQASDDARSSSRGLWGRC